MSESSVVKTPDALRDLREISEFIAKENYVAGVRFLDEMDRAFAALAAMPLMGRIYGFRGRSADLRVWWAAKFRKVLIFYRPIEGGIEVVRVIHGARDLPSALDEPSGRVS